MSIIHISGHLGVDPETRYTPSGQKVITLRIATRARKKDDAPIWWKVTIWGDQFDRMMTYLKKGSAIMVVGEFMKPDIYTDKEGKPQISLNVVAYNITFPPFGRGERQDTQSSSDDIASSYMSKESSHSGVSQGSAPEDHSIDDEIPF